MENIKNIPSMVEGGKIVAINDIFHLLSQGDRTLDSVAVQLSLTPLFLRKSLMQLSAWIIKHNYAIELQNSIDKT